MLVSIHGQTLELAEGDITRQEVDAIVNAANRSLAGAVRALLGRCLRGVCGDIGRTDWVNLMLGGP